MFSAVNQFLQMWGRSPLFEVHKVGLSSEVKLNDGAFSVHTDKHTGRLQILIW